MIKKLLLIALFSLWLTPAMAATYYVRCDGGTPAQCDGTHDAARLGAVDGSDTDSLPDCAYNSHNYVSGANSNTGGAAAIMSGGDTVIIDGELRAGCTPTVSGRAEFGVGRDHPNMPSGINCASAFPYGCVPNHFPAGPSNSQPTKIYGKGWDTGCKTPPQIWGDGSIYYNVGIRSNTDMRCIEITDHSSCIFRHDGDGNIDNNAAEQPIRCLEPYQSGSTAYPGPWSRTGLDLASGSTGIYLENIWIHSMAYVGVWANSLAGDISYKNLYLNANGYVNYTANDNAHYTGNYTWDGGAIDYAGCGEKYPATYPLATTRATLRYAGDKHNCWTQGQGAGYGDGLGANIRWGNWTFKYIDVFGNSSDGIDQLYDGTGTHKYQGLTCEANTGACVKTSSSAYVENSMLLGNCARNKAGQNPTLYADISAAGRSGSNCNLNGRCDANENSTNCSDCTAYGPCRPAQYTPLSFSTGAGRTVNVHGNTIGSNGDTNIYVNCTSCDATTNISIMNNVGTGGTEYNGGEIDTSDWYYQDGSGTPTLSHNYNFICQTKTYSSDCIGAQDQCFANCSSLAFAGTLANFTPTYYTGIDYLTQHFLQVTSPAHTSGANESVTMQGLNLDSTKFNRRSTWDAGGVEYRPSLTISTDYYNVSQ